MGGVTKIFQDNSERRATVFETGCNYFVSVDIILYGCSIYTIF